MHVTIDTNPLYVTRAGVARYIRGLLSGFNELSSEALTVSQLAWAVDSFSYTQPLRGMKTLYRERIWPGTTAARWLRTEQPDILHIMSGLPFCRATRTRAVATLYDLAVIKHPERFRRWHRHAAQDRFKRLHDMDRIICISQFTADEAMALLGLPASRLEVVHLASSFGDKSAKQGEVSLPDSIPAEFFLFVGSLEPGKNLTLLKQAYARAASEGHHLPPLVIVGERWKGVPNEGTPRSDWIYAGILSDAQLAQLYRKALALVFPSQYEGFGLPLLEAMSMGCPVICSRVASLPEVAGDAACYADATAEAYRESMAYLAANADVREGLAARGAERAQRFSWTRCAAETRAVYEMV
ncbi:MAG: glycosyltransferase family 4 protein [Lentisphaerae bacterium]|nr:glycosyltransferase family 4 protein [Lentisphaerota bacterium]